MNEADYVPEAYIKCPHCRGSGLARVPGAFHVTTTTHVDRWSIGSGEVLSVHPPQTLEPGWWLARVEGEQVSFHEVFWDVRQ